MNRWEHEGRFEFAETREVAAILFGRVDPIEVRFAGYSERPMCDRWPIEPNSRARLRVVSAHSAT